MSPHIPGEDPVGPPDATPDIVSEGDEEDDVQLRPPSDDDLVTFADAAFAYSSHWYLAPDRFHTLARTNGVDSNHDAAWPVRYALGFYLELEHDPRPRVTLDSRQVGFEQYQPPRPRDADPAVTRAWERLAGLVTHPASQARFLDLLVLAGGAGTPDRAAAAMSAYVDYGTEARGRLAVTTVDGTSVEIEPRSYDLALALARALSLAHIARTSTHGPAVIARAINASIGTVDRLLDASSPELGTVLLLLEVLETVDSWCTADQRAALRATTNRALGVFADRDHGVDRLARVATQLDPSAREVLERRRIQCRLDIAESRQPMVAMHFLEAAARLASDLGHRDLEADAVRRMQKLGREDPGLLKISAESSMPGEVVEAHMRALCAGADWRSALWSWVTSEPPSGDVDRNRESSERINAGSLRRLLPTVRLGADNLPRWTARTEADHALDDLARTEDFAMSFSAFALADALDTVVMRHGEPSVEELSLFFSNEGRGNHRLATALAKSLHRFWHGDFEGAVHTAAVRVEAGARELVLLLDAPAYSVARAATPGMYVGLDALLDVLADHGFDPSWDRFIRSLLLGPVGRNLRHDVAHGFGAVAESRQTAALVLRALGLFVVLLWEPSAPLGSVAAPVAARPPAWTIIDACVNAVRTALSSRAAAQRVVVDEVRAARAALRCGLSRTSR